MFLCKKWDTPKDEPYQFLSNTTGYLGKHAVINDFKLLKGHYDAYFYWTEHKLLRFLIEITDIDESLNAMTCEMKTDRGEFRGLLIDADTKFFWLFECLPGGRSYPEMFFIVTYKATQKLNYPLMYGIITGGSRSKGGDIVDPSVPQASRVVLKRLKTIPENRKRGRLTLDELREYDPKNWENILKRIDNKIEQSDDILIAYSKNLKA